MFGFVLGSSGFLETNMKYLHWGLYQTPTRTAGADPGGGGGGSIKRAKNVTCMCVKTLRFIT